MWWIVHLEWDSRIAVSQRAVEGTEGQCFNSQASCNPGSLSLFPSVFRKSRESKYFNWWYPGVLRYWRKRLWSPDSICPVSSPKWKRFYQESIYKYFSLQAQLTLKLFWIRSFCSLESRCRKCETVNWRVRGNWIYSLEQIYRKL